MALVLTPQDQETVQKKSKQADKLPAYYSSELRTNVRISRDFEAFLILTEDDTKTKAIDWIKKAVTLQKVNKDRDDLVEMAIAQELKNAEAKIAAIDTKLEKFDDFRTSFAGSKYAAVPEVQVFMFDLQRVVEELVAAKERASFDKVASTVVQRSNDRVKVTEPQVEQLQSWTGVLSVYLQG